MYKGRGPADSSLFGIFLNTTDRKDLATHYTRDFSRAFQTGEWLSVVRQFLNLEYPRRERRLSGPTTV